MPNCDDGCVQLELLLHPKWYDDDCERSSCSESELEKYPCFGEVMDNCGHHRYAVMSYATKKGHLNCLIRLHKLGAAWHNDLAMVAVESDQLHCLRYIVEQMGDVAVNKEELRTSARSKEIRSYIDNMLINTQKCRSESPNIPSEIPRGPSNKET